MAELGDGEGFAAEIMQRLQSFPEEYRLTGVTQSGRHLGNGAYGAVFDGRWHGARVAIKRPHSMLLRDERGHLSAQGSKFFEEMLQHRQLRHPHVAQLLGICPPTPLYESPGLVLEYLPVTLKQRYQSSPPLTALQKADIAAGIASGLSYLHSLSTMHRDLTTNNVMLTSPAAVLCSDGQELMHGIRVLAYVAKITDVGESRNLATGASAQYLTRNPGAQVYMAPETQRRSTEASQRAWYSYSADVYTLGVTVMAMNIGREPPDIFVLARKGRGGDVAAMSADDLMRPIVEQCLQDEPAKRPTAAEVNARLTDVRERQAALAMAAEAEQRCRRAEQEQQQQQSDGDASGGAAATVPDAHPLVIERLESDVRALRAMGTDLAAEKGQLQEANDQLAALNVQLQAEAERLTAEKDQIQATANQLRAERDQFSDQMRLVEGERDQLSHEKRLVEDERNQFSHEKRLVEEDRDQLSNQKQLVEEERDQLFNQKQLVNKECDQLSTENQRLTAEAQQFHRERDDLKAKIRELEQFGPPPLTMKWLQEASPADSAADIWLTNLHDNHLYLAQRSQPFVKRTSRDDLSEWQPISIEHAAGKQIVGLLNDGRHSYIAVHSQQPNEGDRTQVLRLDEPTLSYRPMPNNTSTCMQAFCSVGLMGRRIYFFGGWKETAMSCVSAYDLDAHQWHTSPEDLPEMPMRARCCQTVPLGTHHLLVGAGMQVDTASHEVHVLSQDPASGRVQWERRDDMPSSPRRAGLCLARGHLFQIGGDTGHEQQFDGKPQLNTCLAYALNSRPNSAPQQPRSLASLPSDHHAHCISVVEFRGRLLAVGGFQQRGESRYYKPTIFSHSLCQFPE